MLVEHGYQEIFPSPNSRRLAGFRGITLHRREHDGEVECVTLVRFDNLDAVKAFADPDHELAVVPPRARALLKRFDPRAAHYTTTVND